MKVSKFINVGFVANYFLKQEIWNNTSIWFMKATEITHTFLGIIKMFISENVSALFLLRFQPHCENNTTSVCNTAWIRVHTGWWWWWTCSARGRVWAWRDLDGLASVTSGESADARRFGYEPFLFMWGRRRIVPVALTSAGLGWWGGCCSMTLVYTGDYADLLHKDFLRLIRIITFPTSTIFTANKERKKEKKIILRLCIIQNSQFFYNCEGGSRDPGMISLCMVKRSS